MPMQETMQNYGKPWTAIQETTKNYWILRETVNTHTGNYGKPRLTTENYVKLLETWLPIQDTNFLATCKDLGVDRFTIVYHFPAVYHSLPYLCLGFP